MKAPAYKISFEDNECPDLTGEPIGFENCISAFLVMGTGVGAAILVMIVETIKKKVIDKKHKAEKSNLPIPNEPIRDETSIEVATVEDVQIE